MDSSAKYIAPLGRILLALIFVRGGINKLGTIGLTAHHMAGHGIPHADILVWGAVVMELGGGLLLLTGLFARWAALALCLYTLTLALIFHAFWTMPPAQAHEQASAFFEHLAIMGGMLMVVALGAGAVSLDAAMRPARRPAVA